MTFWELNFFSYFNRVKGAGAAAMSEVRWQQLHCPARVDLRGIMKRIRKKKRENLQSAMITGGPLDGLSVFTYGQPLLLIEDVIEGEKSIFYVKHAYQMNARTPAPDSLLYEYVGWLNTEEADLRSINPELN